MSAHLEDPTLGGGLACGKGRSLYTAWTLQKVMTWQEKYWLNRTLPRQRRQKSSNLHPALVDQVTGKAWGDCSALLWPLWALPGQLGWYPRRNCFPEPQSSHVTQTGLAQPISEGQGQLNWSRTYRRRHFHPGSHSGYEKATKEKAFRQEDKKAELWAWTLPDNNQEFETQSGPRPHRTSVTPLEHPALSAMSSPCLCSAPAETIGSTLTDSCP